MQNKFLGFVFLLVFSIIVFIIPNVAEAATYYDGYAISVDSATNTCRITDVSTAISGDIIVPKTINGYLVTSIGGSAFEACYKITSIEIPNSVTSIGDDAFDGCTSLESIEIPDSVTSIGDLTFCDCTSLESIEIPNSVTSIGYGAFCDCISLMSIEIPNSVTSIGDLTFINCTSLTSIEIPDSVTSIGDDAFSGCTSLTSIEIPDSVASIGNGAFSGCTSLTSIEIPDSVTSIGRSAFSGCTSLTSIEIPNSITSIGDRAFRRCTSLTSIEIPNSVTSIGGSAFEGCTSLEETALPFVGASRAITGTYDSVFGYIFGYSESYTTGVCQQWYSDSDYGYYAIPQSIKKVTITDETIIPYGAFWGCNFITDLIIEGNPSAILADAFGGHNNLWNLTVKSKDVRYPNVEIFNVSDLPTLYGYEGSTTQAYAEKYDLWFEPLSDDTTDEYTLSVEAYLINEKIVLDITSNKAISDKALHVALYKDEDNPELVEYIIVPLNKAYNSFNVVFKDEANSEFAKVFLWDGLETMTPIADAKKITINR